MGNGTKKGGSAKGFPGKRSGSGSGGLPLPVHLEGMLSSLSPLVALDGALRITFASESFLNEFARKRGPVLGEEIHRFFALNRKEREELLQNIERSLDRPVQNCEFRSGRKIFGYTVFRFADGVGLILKEITGLKRLEAKVAHLHARLLDLQERERQRIASELHDSVGQTILAAKLNFNSYWMNPERSRDRFETGLSLIDRASQELREIYTNLYPSTLRDLGLEATIRWYARNFLELKNVDADLRIGLQEKLPHNIEVNVFRMVQELFTNIVKHSGASLVQLELTGPVRGRLRLVVKDNGGGFSVEEARLKSGGYGLENLRSRVEDLEGHMVMESKRGQGTTTRIELPWKRERKG